MVPFFLLLFMMVHCCDPCCLNNSKLPACKNLSWFTFPKDPKLAKLWQTKVGRGKKFDTTYARLCSAHFEDSCFEANLESKFQADGSLSSVAKRRTPRRLKADAVPTIFAHHEYHQEGNGEATSF